MNAFLFAQDVHKIQSEEGPLQLVLDRVPKLLGVLRRQWAPAALVVSFKVRPNSVFITTLAIQCCWVIARDLARGTWTYAKKLQIRPRCQFDPRYTKASALLIMSAACTSLD
jgi:hypothetical protein